jgi:hypothetical protein
MEANRPRILATLQHLHPTKSHPCILHPRPEEALTNQLSRPWLLGRSRNLAIYRYGNRNQLLATGATIQESQHEVYWKLSGADGVYSELLVGKKIQ